MYKKVKYDGLFQSLLYSWPHGSHVGSLRCSRVFCVVTHRCVTLFPSEEDSCVTTQLAVTKKTTMLVIRTKAFPFPKNYKSFKQILPPLPPSKRHCVVLTSNMTTLSCSCKPRIQFRLVRMTPLNNATRGPFLERPGDFSGPKSNIQIQI